MDHPGKQWRGRVTALASLAALAIVACACAYLAAGHSRSQPAPAIDFSEGVVPGEFHSLRIGMTMAEVRSTVGKPQVERPNPQFEVKSDAEWGKIRSELDSRRSAQMEMSSVPDPSYLKLGREYEHRAKDMWVYYPPKLNVWASLQFDGNGKLINAASGHSGKASGLAGKAPGH